MRYSLIVTGYNCERFVRPCIDSLLRQTYKDFEILVFNDASTDNTLQVLNEYKDKIKIYSSLDNVGALEHRYNAIHEYVTGDVVAFVGLDDMLASNALETLNKYYTEEIKMTYGSWITDLGGVFVAEPYPSKVYKRKSFRGEKWRATALNTFRTGLIKQIPPSQLKHKGEFFKNCTDLAYSFPCLEICEESEVAVVTEPIYIYRKAHSNTTLKRFGKPQKTIIRNLLKEKPCMKV